jgi:hypothetical protein
MSASPEETVALEVIHEAPAEVELGTLRAQTPQALVSGATDVAQALAGVVKAQRLSVYIQGREHVKVEGWLTLATMMGCIPREVSCDRQEDGAYVAVVELVRMRDGMVLSRASAECGGPEEGTWQRRAPYARRSMATTRASSKACRIAFSWVMALSGYETTPAEEMDPLGSEPRGRSDGLQPASRQPTRNQSARSGGGDHGAPARTISEKQVTRLHAIATAAKKRTGSTDEAMRAALLRWKVDLHVEHFADLTKAPYDTLCKWLEEVTPERLENFIDDTPDEASAAAFD